MEFVVRVLPLHEKTLQTLFSDASLEQEVAEELHPRRLIWVPPPQVALQDSHGDQKFQP